MCIALVGCGSIARTHIAALNAHNDLLKHQQPDGQTAVTTSEDATSTPTAPTVQIIWAIDAHIERARDLLPEARHTSDLSTALADPTLDAVFICSPHATHCEAVCQSLAAGKHVLSEKPLATTPADLARMQAASATAEQQGLVAGCIFQNRFAAVATALFEQIQAGVFGTLTSARVDFGCTRTKDYYHDDWHGTWEHEGGGLLINQAIHTIDLLCWFCGQPTTVTGTVDNQRLQGVIEVEDEAHGTVTFTSGLVADIACVNDQQTNWEPIVEIHGDRGWFRYHSGQRIHCSRTSRSGSSSNAS